MIEGGAESVAPTTTVIESHLPVIEAGVKYQYTSLPPETAQELVAKGFSHTLAAELHKATGEKPYQALAKVSTLERQGIETSYSKWETDMRQWIETSENKFLARLAGFEPGKKPTNKQIEIGLNKISRFFKTNGDPDITSFASQITEMVEQRKYDLKTLQEESKDFFSFCQVFGQDTGIAVAQLIEREVSKGSQSSEGKSLTQAEEALLNNVSRAVGNVNAETQTKKPEVFSESLESFGAAIIGKRGKEFSHDSRGQDRSYQETLKNGIEVYGIFDGAGQEGHLVADSLGPALVQELTQLQPEQVTPDKIKEIARKLHQQMQKLYNFTSHSGIDALIKLPDGRRFGLHVGEGFMGQVRGKEDFKEGGGGRGQIIKGLVQPQSFGVDKNGKALRMTNEGEIGTTGSKAPNIGVNCKINPEVIEIPEGAEVILASDGFSDVLSQLPISTPDLVSLIKTNPLGAAQYLANLADAYKTAKDYETPDDIAVMIIK